MTEPNVMLQTVRRHVWTVLGATVAVVLGSILYLAGAQPLYEAEATLTFAPAEDAAPSADLVRLAVGSEYVVYAGSAPALRAVADEIGDDPDTLQGALEITVPTNSATLELLFELGSPERAADAANALAEDVARFSEGDPLVRGQVTAPAEPPSAPAGPANAVIVAGACALGLVIGLGLALVTEHLWPSLLTTDDVAHATGVPALGTLPASAVAEGGLTAVASSAPFRRAIGIVCANLASRRSQGATVLAVVSPRDGDGRTTVAAHLGAAIARGGVRVLVVDGDLAHADLRHRLDLSRGPGFVEAIRAGDAGVAAINEAAPGLYVLATDRDATAGDLLPARLDIVLKQLTEHYDLIVVDTAQMLGTATARSLAAAADEVLLVVRVPTAAADVMETVEALQTVDARLVGFVANQRRPRWRRTRRA